MQIQNVLLSRQEIICVKATIGLEETYLMQICSKGKPSNTCLLPISSCLCWFMNKDEHCESSLGWVKVNVGPGGPLIYCNSSVTAIPSALRLFCAYEGTCLFKLVAKICNQGQSINKSINQSNHTPRPHSV